MQAPGRLGKVQVEASALTLNNQSLYGNGAISEICPSNQDVDHDGMALLAQLLALTKDLNHLILIVPGEHQPPGPQAHGGLVII